MKHWPILLTGTIAPHPDAFGLLNDPNVRLREYISNLKKLADTGGDVRRVIFCENSEAACHQITALTDFFRNKGVELEVWKVPLPVSESFSGKGWAEVLMVSWALEHIPSLRDCKAFIKITGRYQVLNLKRILRLIKSAAKIHPDLKYVTPPFSSESRPHVTTHFFWSDCHFFKSKLSDLFRAVNDAKGFYLEHAFAERLLAIKAHYKVGILPIPLIIRATISWNKQPMMSTKKIIKLKIKQAFLPIPELKFLN